MTLLFQYGFRDDFIFMSSDTRRRMQYFDPITLEPNGKYGEPKETKEKIFKVTNYVAGQLGGLVRFGENVINRLLERVKDNFYLDDCTPLLESIVREIDVENKEDEFFQKYKTSNNYAFYLGGYFSDGLLGIVALEKNEVIEVKNAKENELRYMFSPTEEINALHDKIFDFSNDSIVNDNHFDTVVNALVYRHASIAYTHPEIVSSTMMYRGFIKDQQLGIVPFNGEIDLSEHVKRIGELAGNID